MATIKVACPKCGQKVSGDEKFAGTSVSCPICTSNIQFPGEKAAVWSGQVEPKAAPSGQGGSAPIVEKVACTKCGQKVSGDASFAGTSVPCPICTTEIHFPADFAQEQPAEAKKEAAPDDSDEAAKGLAAFDEVVPRASSDQDSDDQKADEELEREDENADDEAGVVPSPVTGAIAMVAGVLGVVLCGLGGILFSPIAIIAGHLSQAKAKQSPVQPAPGQTLGAIGMVIGYLTLFITIILLIVALIFEGPLREAIQNLQS